jgi:hypothetical protein
MPGSSAKVLHADDGSEAVDQVKCSLGQTQELLHTSRTLLPRILELRGQGLNCTQIGQALGLLPAPDFFLLDWALLLGGY